MSYDYKIINVDPSLAFIRRVLLYVALLIGTVALALLVLFILFERYLMLIIPAVMIALAILIFFLTSKRTTIYVYSFTENSLSVTFGRHDRAFILKNVILERNAEKSDFIDKSIVKFSFIKRRIALKNAVNDNTANALDYIISYENKSYLVTLDDYALAIVKGAKDE